MISVMIVAAGPYQLDAIASAQALGCRVVAVDGAKSAPGLKAADLGVVVNILDPDVIVLGGGVGNIDELYTRGVAEVEKQLINGNLSTGVDPVSGELLDGPNAANVSIPTLWAAFALCAHSACSGNSELGFANVPMMPRETKRSRI